MGDAYSDQTFPYVAARRPLPPVVPALATAAVFASLLVVLTYAAWTARSHQAPERIEEQVELSVPLGAARAASITGRPFALAMR